MEFINTEKAAKLLNMHPATVRERAKKKEIPAYKIGKYWRFDPKELEFFVKNSQNRPEQEMGHKENLCHVNSSLSRREGKSGITRTPHQQVIGYAEALGLPTKIKQCN
ncbi:helix-turn-helix domain-containing protein [Avibacterium paragallinarum]|uniref:DNA binding domain, excisionase family n=1 Tax=Avibacterium paragallinarum TaxID=728 RepID=A0A2V4ETF4_AVIPA|nr:helix-turn-helix domain-containing protein [Avibacterium paragallinarum]KAA6209613.1 helix-turn-helix domain-containing protein [Avibacterium paragallinarum]MEE3609401.1 helix-turn-helix domain-containing protein [Avibacterium paragallinarum]MEE3621967.1 helix-turn-helix domain-containing protein [Avibacterium paragallinarum]MEE3669763.1 helix-turn-helix domain-containing protein [Avibacterium paragallinarum]MEE3681949.1 helix-turn-helix domain-containing protein [Avibacterium paragallinaru